MEANGSGQDYNRFLPNKAVKPQEFQTRPRENIWGKLTAWEKVSYQKVSVREMQQVKISITVNTFTASGRRPHPYILFYTTELVRIKGLCWRAQEWQLGFDRICPGISPHNLLISNPTSSPLTSLRTNNTSATSQHHVVHRVSNTYSGLSSLQGPNTVLSRSYLAWGFSYKI